MIATGVSIQEVARRAGVSASTVSRALSGKAAVRPETKRRVLQAVRELDYRPNVLAKSLKEGKSRTIGLIIPNIHHLVFPAAVRGVSDVARKHGYTVVLCNTDEDLGTERAHVENLTGRLVDGLIFSTATQESTHLLSLKERGYPIVLMIRYFSDELDTVMVDNFRGAYEATRFLLARGYREIALINGKLELDLYRQRLAGYRAALAEGGLPAEDDLVVNATVGWEDGYRAVQTIYERGRRPDAFFGTSDPKALGVLKALKDRGVRVPEDVAVMGYDNLEMAELSDPPLTTMAQPFYEVGRRAAERLIKLIERKRRSKPAVERLETRLLVRRSVGYGRGSAGDIRGESRASP
ncbi:MAG: LacI family DNA-binding transcriptional regulator [Bacteroidota bacterium]